MKLIFTVNLSISICLVFMCLLINSSDARSSGNFVSYTNYAMKFSIQYPSNWHVKEDIELPPSGVLFERPSGDDCYNCFFMVEVQKVKPYLDTDTLMLKNTSLQQYVQQTQEMDSKLYQSYKLIRQDEVTVGGNTGWKIEFNPDDFSYVFKITTFANGKFYILFYSEDKLKVPETLPLANKMVESFQIIK